MDEKGGHEGISGEKGAVEDAPDVSSEVLRNSLLFACKNLSKEINPRKKGEQMHLPNVQDPAFINKPAREDRDKACADELEYLWKPSMRVNNDRFANRMEKYSHMEFKRNLSIYRLYTPKGAMLTFFFFGFLLLAAGIALFISSGRSFTLEIPYSEANNDPIEFTIESTLKAPVYFYYKISNFYVTHKKVTYDSSPASIKNGKCKLFNTFEEILNLRCIDGKNTLNGVDEWCNVKDTEPAFKLPAYPCGAISATMMTDRYMVCSSSLGFGLNDLNTKSNSDKCLPLSLWVEGDDHGLFHAGKKKSEINNKFLWMDLDNPMLRSWTQIPYDNTFLKPYAVLNQDLQAGTYKLYLTRNYWPAKAWSAGKAFYIAKTGFLGTSALVFQIMVIATAAVYLASGVVVALLYFGKYSGSRSPWRGIEVVRETEYDISKIPMKYAIVSAPPQYNNVPHTRRPCLCPNHWGVTSELKVES